ncbi:MAG: UxaA family hydrolase [Spirochaetes bacterium]|nr:UxaA family hydrolase [Spirochaetota bacterium]
MKTLLLLSEKDNVFTCMKALKKGDSAAGELTAANDIPVYHKMARAFIPAKGEVYKYGEVIGVASCDIHPGEHVHVHNIESARGRGDKQH